jgi:hypothetical protein
MKKARISLFCKKRNYSAVVFFTFSTESSLLSSSSIVLAAGSRQSRQNICRVGTITYINVVVAATKLLLVKLL